MKLLFESQELVTPTTLSPPGHQFEAIAVQEIEEEEEEGFLSDVLSFHCLLARQAGSGR